MTSPVNNSVVVPFQPDRMQNNKILTTTIIKDIKQTFHNEWNVKKAEDKIVKLLSFYIKQYNSNTNYSVECALVFLLNDPEYEDLTERIINRLNNDFLISKDSLSRIAGREFARIQKESKHTRPTFSFVILALYNDNLNQYPKELVSKAKEIQAKYADEERQKLFSRLDRQDVDENKLSRTINIQSSGKRDDNLEEKCDDSQLLSETKQPIGKKEAKIDPVAWAKKLLEVYRSNPDQHRMSLRNFFIKYPNVLTIQCAYLVAGTRDEDKKKLDPLIIMFAGIAGRYNSLLKNSIITDYLINDTGFSYTVNRIDSALDVHREVPWTHLKLFHGKDGTPYRCLPLSRTGDIIAEIRKFHASKSNCMIMTFLIEGHYVHTLLTKDQYGMIEAVTLETDKKFKEPFREVIETSVLMSYKLNNDEPLLNEWQFKLRDIQKDMKWCDGFPNFSFLSSFAYSSGILGLILKDWIDGTYLRNKPQSPIDCMASMMEFCKYLQDLSTEERATLNLKYRLMTMETALDYSPV